MDFDHSQLLKFYANSRTSVLVNKKDILYLRKKDVFQKLSITYRIYLMTQTDLESK